MKKLKLLPTFLMLVLCVGVLAIGIYAVTPTKNTISGSITINASNADVTITAYKDSTSGTNLGNVVVRSVADLQIPTLEFVTENLNTIDQVQDVTIVVVFTTSSADNLVIETKDYESLDALDADDNVYTNMVTGQKTHLSTVTDTATKLPAFNKENPYTITCTYSLNNFATQDLTVPLKIKFDIYKASEYSAYTTTTHAGKTYYTFGSFPQSKVTDSTLISSLTDTYTNYLAYDDTTGGQTYRDLYVDQSGNEYVLMGTKFYKVEPLTWRQLTTADGKAEILCENVVEQVCYRKNYLTESADGTTYYYAKGADGNKIENTKTGMADDDDDSNDYIYANNYEYSDLRTYLTDTFYNSAFNSLEKSLIPKTLVDNTTLTDEEKEQYMKETSDELNESPYLLAQRDTNDFVYALSYEDAISAPFEADYYCFDVDRMLQRTGYAIATGAGGNGEVTVESFLDGNECGHTTISDYLNCVDCYGEMNYHGDLASTNAASNEIFVQKNSFSSNWLLRSPCHTDGFSYSAHEVSSNGTVSGGAFVNYAQSGCVPALRLSLVGQ